MGKRAQAAKVRGYFRWAKIIPIIGGIAATIGGLGIMGLGAIPTGGVALVIGGIILLLGLVMLYAVFFR